MTDEKNKLIQELAAKVNKLEQIEKNRVKTPWGVYDKDSINQIYWMTIIVIGLGAIIVAYIAMGGKLFNPLSYRL
jgi:uncharacterized protein with ACT and thioredoxin-like domain